MNPPGTCVPIPHNDSHIQGTIQNIPLITSDLISMAATASINSTSSAKYVILLDDNTTTESTFKDLLKVGSFKTDLSTPTVDSFLGLTHFLRDNSKVTMDYQASFHKGYPKHSPEAGF